MASRMRNLRNIGQKMASKSPKKCMGEDKCSLIKNNVPYDSSSATLNINLHYVSHNFNINRDSKNNIHGLPRLLTFSAFKRHISSQ